MKRQELNLYLIANILILVCVCNKLGLQGITSDGIGPIILVCIKFQGGKDMTYHGRNSML